MITLEHLISAISMPASPHALIGFYTGDIGGGDSQKREEKNCQKV